MRRMEVEPTRSGAFRHSTSTTRSEALSARASSALPLLIALILFAGCSLPDRDAALLPGFEEVPSPAAPESGESNLATGSDGEVWMSWIEPEGAAANALRTARLDGDRWGPARTVAEGDSFFVNWADFPSVVPIRPDLLAAHWLVQGPTGGVDYSIWMAYSEDEGETWTEPWIPHEDGTNTEHGFVSLFPWGEDEVGAVWLDGRDYARFDEEGGSDADAPPPEMALRFRAFGPGGEPGPKTILDARVCDCCQTAVAIPNNGPVVAYRDRSAGEIRDISAVRYEGAGWSEPVTVHPDGWEIPACPVNGPAADAAGGHVVLAWFSAANDTPLVRVAFSRDGGATFGPPARVDDGNPAGRVQVRFVDEESAVVSWLERVEGEAQLRVRRLGLAGGMGRSFRVTETDAGRASGFPRMVPLPGERLLFSWTDTREPRQVRTAMTGTPPW